MNILWGILMILGAVAGIVLGCWLLELIVERLLPVKKGWLSLAARYLLFAAALRLPIWIGDANMLIFLPCFLGVFLCCFEGPKAGRLVVGMTIYALLLPVSALVDRLHYVRALDNVEDVLGTLIKVGAIALVWLLVRRLTQEGKFLSLSRRLWILCGFLALAPLFALLSFSICNAFTPDFTVGLPLRVAYTILPFSLLSAVALLVALTVLSRQEELEREYHLAGMRKLYYENLQRQQGQVRTLRHDLRNHLAALQGLLAEGDTARAQDYLAELTQSPALHKARPICANETANVVLSGKLEAAEEKGLTVDALVTLPSRLSISDIDLCALLGNALDNAIEGAEKVADKRILLRARADHGVFMLRVENACDGSLQEKGRGFATTKKDKGAHGFGIEGMREIAERYGGSLDAGAEKGRFELVACLPLEGEGLAEGD